MLFVTVGKHVAVQGVRVHPAQRKHMAWKHILYFWLFNTHTHKHCISLEICAKEFCAVGVQYPTITSRITQSVKISSPHPDI